MDMFLTNAPMGAAEALACGLASRVVADDDLRLAADGIAEGDRRRPARGARRDEAAGAPGRRRAHRRPPRRRGASIGERGLSPEGREGITAFLDKRAPRWPAAT